MSSTLVQIKQENVASRLITLDHSKHSYLKEHFDAMGIEDLPDNCIFNKVLTGCGGTNVALNSNRKYVIAVPLKDIISSKLVDVDLQNKERVKMGRTDEVVIATGLSSKHSIIDCKKAIQNGATKILVTYDSLHRLDKLINFKHWYLLIDEFHELARFEAEKKRNQATTNIRIMHKLFKGFTFMSATPTARRYQADYMLELPIIKIVWEGTEPLSISRIKVDMAIPKFLAYTMGEFIDGSKTGNAHVFINSVEIIIEALSQLVLYRPSIAKDLSKYVRVVLGKKASNTKLLNRIFQLENTEITDQASVTKINFYTSTAFIGCDIQDENGRVFLVTDGSRSRTLFDMAQSGVQASGRIRNTIYTGITHWYTNSPYYVEEKDFKQALDVEVTGATSIATMYSTASIDMQKYMLSKFNNPHLSFDEVEQKLIVNTSVEKYMWSTYFTLLDEYSARSKKVYVDVAYDKKIRNLPTIDVHGNLVKGDVVGVCPSKRRVRVKTTEAASSYSNLESRVEIHRESLSISSKDFTVAKRSELGYSVDFRSIWNELVAVIKRKNNGDISAVFEIPDLIDADPLIKRAYEVLGEDTILHTRANRGEVNKKLIVQDTTYSNHSKIQKLLNYPDGIVLSNTKLNEDMYNVFLRLGIEGVYKGGLASTFYLCKKTKVYTDGMWLHGMKIVAKRTAAKVTPFVPEKPTMIFN
jgi:hypothetical protein